MHSHCLFSAQVAPPLLFNGPGSREWCHLQWATMGYNGLQWATMGYNALCSSTPINNQDNSYKHAHRPTWSKTFFSWNLHLQVGSSWQVKHQCRPGRWSNRYGTHQASLLAWVQSGTHIRWKERPYGTKSSSNFHNSPLNPPPPE